MSISNILFPKQASIWMNRIKIMTDFLGNSFVMCEKCNLKYNFCNTHKTLVSFLCLTSIYMIIQKSL
jgi:hypothetical protein